MIRRSRIQWQTIKQPKGFRRTFPGDIEPHVTTNADVERNLFVDQFAEPIISDEFTIGQKSLNAFFTEQVKEALNQFLSLKGIGVPPFGQHRPKYWNSHSMIRNTEQQIKPGG